VPAPTGSTGSAGAATTRSATRLAPPTGLLAEPGGHQVTLTWDPVPGAVGYQVHVASSSGGDLEPLDHHGRDVLAVPHAPYVDTTGAVGEERLYAVSTLSDVSVQGATSAPVAATPLPDAGTGHRRGRRRR
jgi:xylan 1,4-beta-xylosidase